MSNFISNNSIASFFWFIHYFEIFCITNRHSQQFLFPGLCPDPVSGIRNGNIGHTVNVEGIKE
jgi:hypothetical protein